VDKLLELMSLCKCGISISINDHKDVYQTAEQRLADMEATGQLDDVDQQVIACIIERDCLIQIFAYPDTPVGNYACVHYDLELSLTEVVDAIKGERAKRVATRATQLNKTLA